MTRVCGRKIFYISNMNIFCVEKRGVKCMQKYEIYSVRGTKVCRGYLKLYHCQSSLTEGVKSVCRLLTGCHM